MAEKFHMGNQGYSSHRERPAFSVQGRFLCWDVAFSQREMIWDQIPTEILQCEFYSGW